MRAMPQEAEAAIVVAPADADPHTAVIEGDERRQDEIELGGRRSCRRASVPGCRRNSPQAWLPGSTSANVIVMPRRTERRVLALLPRCSMSGASDGSPSNARNNAMRRARRNSGRRTEVCVEWLDPLPRGARRAARGVSRVRSRRNWRRAGSDVGVMLPACAVTNRCSRTGATSGVHRQDLRLPG